MLCSTVSSFILQLHGSLTFNSPDSSAANQMEQNRSGALSKPHSKELSLSDSSAVFLKDLACKSYLYLTQLGAHSVKGGKNEKSFLLNVYGVVVFCYSVAKSCLTLQSHGLQHPRLPCPSLSPRVCSNSCPLLLSHFSRVQLCVTP